LNVFAGGNGSGKTSILEAIYVLGRGRSFRAPDHRLLIRKGEAAAEVLGSIPTVGGDRRIGLRIAPGGLETRLDGQTGVPITELVATLPVQAIDAEVGSLVQGAPELRRRMLDWGVFHVEHRYLTRWREYRRTLTQRNAALRAGETDGILDAWDAQLVEAGIALDQFRLGYLERLVPQFERIALTLLDADVRLDYQRGWAAGHELRDALRSARESDRELGYSRLGPHRADLQFAINTESSRWRASRGQQKLLAAALVLAVCQVVAAEDGRSIVLLVDEPAADLDAQHLSRLMKCLLATPAQIFIAAIDANGLLLPSAKMMFHVEHGCAKALL
jgi:DNA replication and repair protein RecF